MCKDLRDLRVKDLAYSEIEEHSENDRETANDRLWKMSLLLGKCPRPGWSGMMTMLNTGDHPGQSSVMFLPMIDMDPGDLTCIHSTLHFIHDHAACYQVTPIITFYQPLWWKVMTIIENEAHGSRLKCIILRLGGFHVLMSFLGTIRHLMPGCGLEEILELVYAPNTVPKILCGKAIAMAIRGHFLVDGALNTLLAAKSFQVELPIPGCYSIELDDVSELTDDCLVDDDNEDPHDEPFSEQPDGDRSGHSKVLPKELEEASDFYDSVMAATTTETNESQILQLIARHLEAEKEKMVDDRTTALWLQYMVMLDLVCAFIRSERTGNWNLHLDAMTNMMPFMAASGHLYVKSLRIYGQKMHQLENTHPQVYKRCLCEANDNIL